MSETPSIVELFERLTRLEAMVAERDAALAERDARIEVLVAQNAELRRRLGQNPRNSNLPPSSEGWPSRRRSRCVSGRGVGRVVRAGMRARPCVRWIGRM